MISNSFARPDLYGKYEIIMQFTDAGRKRFAEVTRDIAAEGQKTGRPGRLAIVLDGTLYSAPTVKEEIDSPSAQITGSFTDREAINLANVLNNPLDLPLVVKEQFEVSPSLAEDAISSGVRASVIGLVVVAAFMITFYTTGGLVAVATLLVNLVIILGVMANIGATMTLPGLAGIVLTIGMAVDANILIFERMREELAAGKSLSSANQTGFSKALMTIIDAHVVQLIICAIMIWLGRGPIRGFGVTLAIGVLSTMFTVLVTAHLVMELLIDSGTIKKLRMGHILKALHADFVKYGLPSFIGSWTIVLLGLCVVFYQGPAHLRRRLLGRRRRHDPLHAAPRRGKHPAGGRGLQGRRHQRVLRERAWRGRGAAEDRDARGQVGHPPRGPAEGVPERGPRPGRRAARRGHDRPRGHAQTPPRRSACRCSSSSSTSPSGSSSASGSARWSPSPTTS